MRETLTKIAYMLQSNRFRVAILTLVAEIVVLFGLELDPEKAEHISTLIAGIGGVLIAALSFRDPTARSSAGFSRLSALALLAGAVLLFAVCPLLLGGCMRALQGPATDHAIQTNTIAERCRVKVGGYAEAPCSEDLQHDLDHMAKQSDCIEAIAQGKECNVEVAR